MKLAGAGVLDIGCGEGANLVRLHNAGAQVMGIDLDEEAIAFVQSQLRLNAYCGNLLEADLER